MYGTSSRRLRLKTKEIHFSIDLCLNNIVSSILARSFLPEQILSLKYCHSKNDM